MVSGAIISQLNLQELENTENYDKDLYEKLKARFYAPYRYNALKGLFTKTTVSELKKKAMAEAEEISVKPAPYADDDAPAIPETDSGDKTAQKEALTGAERGTAYHRIMELLDADPFGDPNEKNIGAWMAKLAESRIIPEEFILCVKPADIAAFLETDLGKRMNAAFGRKELFREKPFMMGVSAKELDAKFPEEEMVLIQGIVDVWFLEDGEIVLLDYKTDMVSSEKTLTDRYAVQLELYKRALEAATGKKVKETYIYSFTLNKVIKL